MARWSVVMLGMASLLPGRADSVLFKDGAVREGNVTSRDNDELRLEVSHGGLRAVISYPADTVVSVDESPSPYEVLQGAYEARRRETRETADSWLALGLWCRERLLFDETRTALEHALSLDRDHAGVRSALGYVRHEGQWVTEDEYRRDLGYVRTPAGWIPRVESLRLERERARLRLLAAKEELARALTVGQAVAASLEDLRGDIDAFAEDEELAERQGAFERAADEDRGSDGFWPRQPLGHWPWPGGPQPTPPNPGPGLPPKPPLPPGP